MRFLTFGSLTPAVAEAIARHGHTPVTLTSLGLEEDTPHDEILKAADKAQLDVLTADGALAEAPFEHDIWFRRTLVFLQLAGGEVEQDDAIDRLFTRYKRLAPRRLYTVTENRVKIRQLPQGHRA